ncbi:COG3014 family protein [Kerstersia similis]|uniref:COG3014 family protein n=1 Tax=Kerstersia similis TaxID=206505 RepID=UPI0039F0BFBE
MILQRGACLVAAGLLAGCAATHDSKVGESANDLAAGLLDSAILRVETQMQGEAAEDLLLNLEKGELLRVAARYEESQQALETADVTVRAWEDQVRGALTTVGTQISATLFGDGMRDYEGQDYEKVMLTTRMAMNRLNMGDLENARVDIRRTHEREALIAEARSRANAEVEAQAQEQGVEVEQKEISGYPVEIFDDPAVIGLKNGYQNALSHYLAGFVYETLNEPSLAAAGYRQAIELRPDETTLQAGLEGLEERQRRLATAKETDVLFVIETGLAPARRSQSIVLPVPTHNGLLTLATAFPVIQPNPYALDLQQISIAGQSVPVAQAADLNAMARRALRDELPGMLTRSSIRLVTKAVLQNEINQQAGPLAGLFAALVSAATEPAADDRMWRMLPERVYLARAFVPHGRHELKLSEDSHALRTLDVRGQRMVVPVRMLSTVTYFGAPAYLDGATAGQAGSARQAMEAAALRFPVSLTQDRQ